MSDFAGFAKAMSSAMTVQQVAEILGVTPEAIKKHVRELYPEALKKGVPTILTEEMVVEIKRRMIPTTQVVGSVTELEMKEKALEVMTWLASERVRLTARLAIVEPKAAYADDISNADGGIPLSDFAKVLAGKGWEIGRNRLFNLLIDSGLLFRKYESGVKKYVAQPYQEQIEAGRFLLHQVTVNPMNTIYPQTRITPKGQKYVIDHLVEWEVKRLMKEKAS